MNPETDIRRFVSLDEIEAVLRREADSVLCDFPPGQLRDDLTAELVRRMMAELGDDLPQPVDVGVHLGPDLPPVPVDTGVQHGPDRAPTLVDAMLIADRARRWRLRIQLAVSGLTTVLAAWHLIHGEGDWLWSLDAGLGLLAFIGTCTQLEDARRAYEGAQLLVGLDAVGPARNTADETTDPNGDRQ